MTPERYQKLRTLCDELAVEFLPDLAPYFRQLASMRAQRAYVQQLIAAKEEHAICDECGHPVDLHFDPYGCEHERGDQWVDGEGGSNYVAMGPCGCTAWTVVEERVA